MTATPDTRYAEADGVHIAYQVVGDGPVDLVSVPAFVSHVELYWDEPIAARFRHRLASFTRLIVFDKRGTGLSDRVTDAATLEERMDDIRAVMDAVGSKKAAVFGSSEGGTMAALFAASYPERTSALLLWESFPRFIQAEDYPWGHQAEEFDQWVEQIRRSWIDGEAGFGGLRPGDDEAEKVKRWFVRVARSGASPREAVALASMMRDVDIRHVLPSIRVPTLAMAREGGNRWATQYMAERIPGAKFVSLPGDQHAPFLGDQESVVAEIQEFLTGIRPQPEPDRVLATVLFTDIVGSTGEAVKRGDRRWLEILDDHDAMVRRQIEAQRGRLIKTTGDGVLATFDGPARAVRCADGIVRGANEIGIELRAGLHAGEVELRNGDIGGIAVHIASRVAGLAGPGEVLVSGTVTDLVAGSGIEFESRGQHELKGVSGKRMVFAVSRA